MIDILSNDKVSIEKAKAWIRGITALRELYETYLGKVKSIVPFGAFVEILPGKDGLLHISEIDHKRIEKVEDVLREGDKIKVKLIGIDSRSGKLKLSRKVLLERPQRRDDNQNR